MDVATKESLKTIFKLVPTENDNGLIEYCRSINNLPNNEDFSDAEWKKLLFGSNPGPSLGMALSAWPKDDRAELKDYAQIAMRLKEDTLTRDKYIQFRQEFFDKCHGKKPKIVFNRLVGLMFPMQFVQIPKEEDMSVVFNGLDKLGAFEDELGQEDKSDNENEEGQWYDESTAVMNAFKNVSEQSSDGTYIIFGGNAYKLISFFKANPCADRKAIIKYGPPGTGKTFSAKNEAMNMLNAWNVLIGGGQNTLSLKPQEHIQTIQFHPSFGYEDFIEGLRPFRVDYEIDNPSPSSGNVNEQFISERDANKQSIFPLRLVNGSFKGFCKLAGRWEIDLAKFAKGKLQKVEDLLSLPLETFKKDILSKSPQEFCVSANELRDEWKMIKSLRPIQKNIKLCDALPPYVFIIDEINRADLSRVLGELMLCIENRGPDHAVSTQYAAINDNVTGMINFGDSESHPDWRFFVPTNVHIVGTMNVIDRSVESFDFALRRRFYWERDDPDRSVVEMFVKNLGNRNKWKDSRMQAVSERLANGFDALNGAIKNDQNLGDDWQIGHAYFKSIEQMDVGHRNTDAIAKYLAETIWGRSIRPLLEEYLRGNGNVDKRLEEFHKKFLIKEDKKGKTMK